MNSPRLCWICEQNVANTSEHSLKKSDIVRAYGKGSYRELAEGHPIHYKNGKETKLQGPNSDVIKNPKDLCKICNNTLTQPYDRSYDKFVEYIIQNHQKILEKRFIDFEEVYGENFGIEQTNLFKYFLKSFGCRIYANPNYKIPADIRKIVKSNIYHFQTGLKITMSISTNTIEYLDHQCFDFIEKGEMIAYNIQNIPELHGFTFKEHIGWFFINYFYLIDVDDRSGVEWIANRKVIFLGEI